MGKKTESSRLNLFYILHVLANYTDEEHPMSLSEIKNRVDEEFNFLSSTDVVMSADTVKRTMEELTDKIFVSGEDDKQKYGYSIRYLMKKDGKYAPYKEKDDEQPPKRYYYYDSNLTGAELLIIKDAIETYSYFSEEDIAEIIRKLIKLRPQSFPKGSYYDAARENRDEDSLLLMNIDDLNRIINNKNDASITYCHYNTEKRLVPRPGYPKIIKPMHLMWSNGYYYLLAYNEKYKDIVSMRIDRITEIEEVPSEDNPQAEQFNPVQYRYSHPIMFGGEKETIVMLWRDTGRNYIMNTIMDIFGKNAKVTKAPMELVKKYLPESQTQDEDWLKVTVEAAVGGVELVAAQYCGDCVIISPERLRERVKQKLTQGLKNYN